MGAGSVLWAFNFSGTVLLFPKVGKMVVVVVDGIIIVTDVSITY